MLGEHVTRRVFKHQRNISIQIKEQPQKIPVHLASCWAPARYEAKSSLAERLSAPLGVSAVSRQKVTRLLLPIQTHGKPICSLTVSPVEDKQSCWALGKATFSGNKVGVSTIERRWRHYEWIAWAKAADNMGGHEWFPPGTLAKVIDYICH